VTRLKILGRANSFNVRKVLWVCDELGVDYTREDWDEGFVRRPKQNSCVSIPLALYRLLSTMVR
jgi:hypothetical protein